jgi:hypothetical protein
VTDLAVALFASLRKPFLRFAHAHYSFVSQAGAGTTFWFALPEAK